MPLPVIPAYAPVPPVSVYVPWKLTVSRQVFGFMDWVPLPGECLRLTVPLENTSMDVLFCRFS